MKPPAETLTVSAIPDLVKTTSTKKTAYWPSVHSVTRGLNKAKYSSIGFFLREESVFKIATHSFNEHLLGASYGPDSVPAPQIQIESAGYCWQIP